MILKTLIIPNKKEQLKDLEKLCDGFILGIKDLSVNMNVYFTVDEINKLNTNKEVFIALNKNMHNADLFFLEKTLSELKNIKGVLFYDVAVVNIYNRIKPKYDLVWSQEHLTTNSVTCNFWFDEGVRYTYLSGDITLDEIINIKEKSKMSLLVPIFGYLPMFVSKRHLVKNYLECFNIEDNSEINYLKKDNELYPIIDKNVTQVYSANILNGITAYNLLNEHNIDYIVLNGFNIESDKFKRVCEIYKTNNNIEEIDEMFTNTDTGFLYKETIYKVKKND